jgi:hypothetical protein
VLDCITLPRGTLRRENGVKAKGLDGFQITIIMARHNKNKITSNDEDKRFMKDLVF